jgi:hypothetical protein
MTALMPIEYDEQGQDQQLVKTLFGEIDWTPFIQSACHLFKTNVCNV